MKLGGNVVNLGLEDLFLVFDTNLKKNEKIDKITLSLDFPCNGRQNADNLCKQFGPRSGPK